MALKKSIKTKFGYENKAGWSKVQEEYIILPFLNGKIAFAFMESFIRAIEKLVIKDAVDWAKKTHELNLVTGSIASSN